MSGSRVEEEATKNDAIVHYSRKSTSKLRGEPLGTFSPQTSSPRRSEAGANDSRSIDHSQHQHSNLLAIISEAYNSLGIQRSRIRRSEQLAPLRAIPEAGIPGRRNPSGRGRIPRTRLTTDRSSDDYSFPLPVSDFYGRRYSSHSSDTWNRCRAEKANFENYSRRIGRFRDGAVPLLFRPPALSCRITDHASCE